MCECMLGQVRLASTPTYPQILRAVAFSKGKSGFVLRPMISPSPPLSLSHADMHIFSSATITWGAINFDFSPRSFFFMRSSTRLIRPFPPPPSEEGGGWGPPAACTRVIRCIVKCSQNFNRPSRNSHKSSPFLPPPPPTSCSCNVAVEKEFLPFKISQDSRIFLAPLPVI